MLNNKGKKKLTCILVEDDNDHAEIFMRGLQSPNGNDFKHVSVLRFTEGESVLRYIAQSNQDGIAEAPALIVIDLNLPRVDGFELIKAVRASHILSLVPIVVWTTSMAKRDAERAYRMGANSYIVKPLEIKALLAMLGSLFSFWTLFNQTTEPLVPAHESSFGVSR